MLLRHRGRSSPASQAVQLCQRRAPRLRVLRWRVPAQPTWPCPGRTSPPATQNPPTPHFRSPSTVLPAGPLPHWLAGSVLGVPPPGGRRSGRCSRRPVVWPRFFGCEPLVLATTCGASRDSGAEVRGVGAARPEAAETRNWRRGRREGRAKATVDRAGAEEGGAWRAGLHARRRGDGIGGVVRASGEEGGA